QLEKCEERASSYLWKFIINSANNIFQVKICTNIKSII
ncbi:MAG: hypothetical protein ACI86H_000001, partial [bacterium]